MVIADTSILSTFARIQRLDLLFTSVEANTFYLPPAIRSEIHQGLQQGLQFLQPIIDGLSAAKEFRAIELVDEEKRLIISLPKALNAGEKEGIALCLNRKGHKFLTNDKRAHGFCVENKIASLDLKRVLRQLWKAGHCTKDEVKRLLDAIELSEPGMVIKGRDEILR